MTENSEVVFTGTGQEVLTCPHASGGKDWEAGAYSPLTNTMYMPLRNVCARMLAITAGDEVLASFAVWSGLRGATLRVLIRSRRRPRPEPRSAATRGLKRLKNQGVSSVYGSC